MWKNFILKLISKETAKKRWKVHFHAYPGDCIFLKQIFILYKCSKQQIRLKLMKNYFIAMIISRSAVIWWSFGVHVFICIRQCIATGKIVDTGRVHSLVQAVAQSRSTSHLPIRTSRPSLGKPQNQVVDRGST